MADKGVLLLPEVEEVLDKNYGLKAESLEPVRRAYKVVTEQGVKGLLHAPDEDRLVFLSTIIDHAEKNGFNQMPKLVPTVKGSYSVRLGGMYWFLMDWVGGAESDLLDDIQLASTATMYANFHNSTQGFSYRSKSWNNVGLWPENFRRRREDLREIKKRISSKKARGKYDRLVSENIDYFLEQADIAIELLGKSPYSKMAQKGGPHTSAVHHSCYDHNLIWSTSGTMYMVDYGKMIIDIPIHDVANFMIRHIRHLKWDIQRGQFILQTYSATRKIADEERELLKILLYFPQKFWKVATKHYNSKEADPNLVSSLARVLREQEPKKAFIEAFDSLVF